MGGKAGSENVIVDPLVWFSYLAQNVGAWSQMTEKAKSGFEDEANVYSNNSAKKINFHAPNRSSWIS